MKILYNNPKKSSWTLTRESRPDGTFKIHSGYGGDGYFHYYNKRDMGPTEEIENVIFEAYIRLTGSSRGRSSVVFTFEDADGIHQYQAGAQAMTKIITALQDPTDETVMFVPNLGLIRGTFTFAKQGSEIYLMPYTESV